MNNVNLSIYGKDRKYVPEGTLASVALPEATDSYAPVGHKTLLDMIRSHAERSGLRIMQEVHALARKGQRYFGLMQVQYDRLPDSDLGFIIGIRNSYDKSIPASIACGCSVMVCSNMAFSSEVVLGRRHTVNVMRDLPSMIASGLVAIMGDWGKQIDRFGMYRTRDIGDLEAHDIIAEAYRAGAVSPKQVANVIDQWHTPNHPEFMDRNVYALHNAFTEVWKQNLPEIVLANSAALHPLLDARCA